MEHVASPFPDICSRPATRDLEVKYATCFDDPAAKTEARRRRSESFGTRAVTGVTFARGPHEHAP
jgi:hypothetical protein